MAAKITRPSKIDNFIFSLLYILVAFYIFHFVHRKLFYVDCSKFNLRLPSLLTDYHIYMEEKLMFSVRERERRLFTFFWNVNVILFGECKRLDKEGKMKWIAHRGQML